MLCVISLMKYAKNKQYAVHNFTDHLKKIIILLILIISVNVNIIQYYTMPFKKLNI